MSNVLSLSDAKARLSEVVRTVRTEGDDVVITVDGEPAVRIVAIDPGPRPLTAAEVASHQALMQALLRIERPSTPFDAVELIAEGRR